MPTQESHVTTPEMNLLHREAARVSNAPAHAKTRLRFTETSLVEDTIGPEYRAAFLKLQGMLTNPPKNAVNPHYKNRYANLSGTLAHIKPALTACGFIITQKANGRSRDGKHVLFVVTTITHISGQWDRSYGEWPSQGDPQKIMSALTYAKRGELNAMLCICGGDDDDGNSQMPKPATSAGFQTPRHPSSEPKVPAPKAPGMTEAQKERLAPLCSELGLTGPAINAAARALTGARSCAAMTEVQTDSFLAQLGKFTDAEDCAQAIAAAKGGE